MQEQHPIRAPRREPRQRGLLVSYNALAGVLGVVAAAGIAIVVLWQTGVLFASSAKKASAPARPAPTIHFHYPKSWSPVPKSGWGAIGAPNNAAAVLQRRGNSANFVVIRGTKTVIDSQTALKISNQLKKRYSDYKFLSAKGIRLPHIAARGMFFSYGRTQQGVLHTITIIPAGPISFIVETASPPKSKAIARQIGAILKTATLTYPKK